MNADTYHQAADLFLRLCDQPPERRGAWLAEHCEDESLRKLVWQLAANDEMICDAARQPRDPPDPGSVASPGFDTRADLADQETVGSHSNRESWGDYTGLKEIGRGGIGVIYRARQGSLSRDVALKMLVGAGKVSPSTLLRFRMEAEAAARLNHPHIVPIYEIGEVEGQPFFSMKLIDGPNLAQWMRDETRELRDKVDILIKTARAIHFAHQNGVLHRDIKPANILIDADGQPHVTDFGLAKHLDMDFDLTMTGQILGTPSYMSPEQASGNGTATTVATDVYSLGAVLYNCLTGRPPFDSANIYETVRQVVETDPAAPSLLHPGVDRDLETICLRCLQKDPARRYGSADDVATELQRWSRGEPILARPIGPIGRTVKWARRKPATASLSLAVVTTACLAVAITFGLRAGYENAQRTEKMETLVQSVIDADTSRIPAVVKSLDPVRDLADERLRMLLSKASDGTTEKLHLALALLPSDTTQVVYLTDQLPSLELKQFLVVRDAIRRLLVNDEATLDRLWSFAAEGETLPSQRFQTLAALASYVPYDPRWPSESSFVVNHLIEQVPLANLRTWVQQFRSIRGELVDRSTELLAQHTLVSSGVRTRAAHVLAESLSDQPERLVDVLLIDDDPAVFTVIVESLRPHAVNVESRLNAYLVQPAEIQGPADVGLDRRAIVAAALIELRSADAVWPLLRYSTDPSFRSAMIKSLWRFKADPVVLASRLKVEPNVTVCRALIQVLSGLDPDLLAAGRRDQIVGELSGRYLSDTDPGLHAALAQMLGNWNVPLPEIQPGMPRISEDRAKKLADLDSQIRRLQQKRNYVADNPPDDQAEWEQRLASAPAKLLANDFARYTFDDPDDPLLDLISNSGGRPVGPGEMKWAPGLVGSAAVIGDAKTIECETAFSPEFSDQFSYGAWILREVNIDDDEYGAVLSKMNGGRGFDLWMNDGRIATHMVDSGRKMIKVAGRVKLPVSVWQHVFATTDGSGDASGIALYVNGQPVESTVYEPGVNQSIQNDGKFSIGKRYVGNASSGEYPFHGLIDDVRVFDRRLAADEVRDLFYESLAQVARIHHSQRTPSQTEVLLATHRREILEPIDAQLTKLEQERFEIRWTGSRRWYVSNGGPMMSVISQPSDPEAGEAFSYAYATSITPVTVEQFQRFNPDAKYDLSFAPSIHCPINSVSRHEAAAYCNWLSRQDGIGEEQWSYALSDAGDNGIETLAKPNFRQLQGYRLPILAEWHYACRAGTTTKYFFGDSPSLFPQYGWSSENAGGISHEVGSRLPNDFGLFEMHGGMWEWCQDGMRNDCRLAGGSLHSPAADLDWDISASRSQYARNADNGFRVVRSVK